MKKDTSKFDYDYLTKWTIDNFHIGNCDDEKNFSMLKLALSEVFKKGYDMGYDDGNDDGYFSSDDSCMGVPSDWDE